MCSGNYRCVIVNVWNFFIGLLCFWGQVVLATSMSLANYNAHVFCFWKWFHSSNVLKKELFEFFETFLKTFQVLLLALAEAATGGSGKEKKMTLAKETLAQVFLGEFCEIFKSTFFTEHLWAPAPGLGLTFVFLVFLWINLKRSSEKPKVLNR